MDKNVLRLIGERDDIGSLPISGIAKRYARGKGMKFLKNKQQMYIKLIGGLTGANTAHSKNPFSNKDTNPGNRTA
jgi:hypothetical protein